MKKKQIETLFLDIGGVILTNGWDKESRQSAAKKFHLEFEEMEKRHQLTFNTFEIGKITLEEYLNRVVFFKERDFSHGDFQKFMFAQSKPYPEMLKLIKELKKRHNLKIVAVSNEGMELTQYRIGKFQLDSFIDTFIVSGFVHFLKPDYDIYQLAIKSSQTPVERVLYLDDRKLFLEVAEQLGIQALHHTDYESTLKKLSKYALV